MEVVIAWLVAAGIIVAMILSDAPTWGWLAMLGAAAVGNLIGWMLA